MSGSSKRTLRMPFSFHSPSTRSTETDFFSAIAIASTPASVVPDTDLQPAVADHGQHLGGSGPGHDRKHAALAAVAAQQCGGDYARRLEVGAVPSERRIRGPD